MKPKYPVVLASSSPRRVELLKKLFDDFEVLPADIEEHEQIRDPKRLAVALACEKAHAVAEMRPNSLVIGADTVVAIGDELLGKPLNVSDAIRMLSCLSGMTHRVCTGVCVVAPGGDRVDFVEETHVTFREIAGDEIEQYVATGEPMDKAGAYAIQGGAAKFVASVEGDYDNVVGLPIGALRANLLKHGWAE
jgi:septum formation protein